MRHLSFKQYKRGEGEEVRVKQHIVSSGIISSVIYALTNSPLSAIASFLAGVFIDLDHVIDYYLNYGFNHKFKEAYEAMVNFRLSRIYLFLHSLELLAVFWVVIFLIPLGSIYCAIAIGFTQHIIFDQISNPVSPKAYFLSYRVSNKFKHESIIDPLRLTKTQ